ncbi:MAG TPA: leucyl aminopeptidase [Patescibacteria group bacterium]|jgi:leucyl aminopeptidase|nr:leucyl aminopeptidase [Patescibacteria group bacterium]
MISIHLKHEKSSEISKGVHVRFVHSDEQTLQLDAVRLLHPTIENILTARHFKGSAGEVVSIPLPASAESYLMIVGIGSKNKHTFLCVESYRRAIAKVIRAAIGLYAPSVSIHLPEAQLFNCTLEYLIEQTTIIAQMSTYHFDQYITDQDRKEHRIHDVYLITDAAENQLHQKATHQGSIIGKAVNQARHWIDTPPLDATPLFLSEKAVEIGKIHNLKVTVFDEKQIINMGMGGLAGVSRGSDVDCQLVIMEYKSTTPNASTLALVGKGITFDSGGLSLKPAASMESMKDDMSGAAAVINTMEVIAQLKPNINVIALAPLSENLPSGKATKPGDILKFYNGKTAEIKNTDAEGRLILADALSYAVKHYKPDAIIDIATLTGACAYALGPYFTGLMSEHDDLVAKIEAASKKVGDPVWRLPMTGDYKKAIKSEVADICNIGDGRIKAGAITAAHFLQHFVGDTPWAHLDIAGTAFDVPNIPYFRSGATGAGVRLLIGVVMNW